MTPADFTHPQHASDSELDRQARWVVLTFRLYLLAVVAKIGSLGYWTLEAQRYQEALRLGDYFIETEYGITNIVTDTVLYTTLFAQPLDSWPLFLLGLVCVHAFVRWQLCVHRSVLALSEGSHSPARSSLLLDAWKEPRIGVIFWFLPFVNLIHPARLLIKLARECGPRSDKTAVYATKVWWRFWLAACVIEGAVLFSNTVFGGGYWVSAGPIPLYANSAAVANPLALLSVVSADAMSQFADLGQSFFRDTRAVAFPSVDFELYLSQGAQVLFAAQAVCAGVFALVTWRAVVMVRSITSELKSYRTRSAFG